MHAANEMICKSNELCLKDRKEQIKPPCGLNAHMMSKFDFNRTSDGLHNRNIPEVWANEDKRWPRRGFVRRHVKLLIRRRFRSLSPNHMLLSGALPLVARNVKLLRSRHVTYLQPEGGCWRRKQLFEHGEVLREDSESADRHKDSCNNEVLAERCCPCITRILISVRLVRPLMRAVSFRRSCVARSWMADFNKIQTPHTSFSS